MPATHVPDCNQLNTLVSLILNSETPPHTLRPEVLEMTEILASVASFAHTEHEDIATGKTEATTDLNRQVYELRLAADPAMLKE
jgi:hypothetical protein